MRVGGVTGIVGPNGAGKTLAAMSLVVVPAFQQGVPVCSSVPLHPERVGFDEALYVPLSSWRVMPRLGQHFMCPSCYVVDGACGHVERDALIPRCDLDSGEMWSLTGNKPCVLVLDEINALLPSGEQANIPAELARLLNQFRKPGVRVVWTGPAWARAMKPLREVTAVVIVCAGYWGDAWYRDVEGKKVTRVDPMDWPPNRVFKWRSFDATMLNENSFTSSDVAETDSAESKIYWRRAKKLPGRVYDTRAQVPVLDAFGVCGDCGLPMKKQTCGGHGIEKVLRRVAS